MPIAFDDSWGQLAERVAGIVTRHLADLPPRRVSPWFTPDDAAAYVRLTVRGLEDMRAKGTGPHYHKVGERVVRYHVRDLDAWLLGKGGRRG
ncbi:MAG: helix-turn-helix domain-containing protein [Sphingobium sp.]